MAVSFILCVSYADLFTSGLGCVSNDNNKPARDASDTFDLSSELTEAGEPGDSSTEGVDATVRDSAAVDATVTAPNTGGCQAAFTQLVSGAGNGGSLQVIGLAGGGLQLAGFETGGVAAPAGWQPGTALPSLTTQLASIATGSVGTELAVFGVGASDGFAYLGAIQDGTGAWSGGSELPGQTVALSALTTGPGWTSAGAPALQVLGLGTGDGFAHVAASQAAGSTWASGMSLPNQTKLSTLLTGTGRDSSHNPTLVVVGLGASDGYAYLAAAESGTGTWSGGMLLPNQSVRFSALAAGPGGNVSTPAFQMVGLGATNGLPYLAAWQDNSGTWYGGFALTAQTVALSSIGAALGTDTTGAAALQVVGLGKADGLPYVATWQNANGNWNPNNVGWVDATGTTRAASVALPNPGVPLSELTVIAADGVVQVFAFDATHGQAILVTYQVKGEWYPGFSLCQAPSDAGSAPSVDSGTNDSSAAIDSSVDSSGLPAIDSGSRLLDGGP